MIKEFVDPAKIADSVINSPSGNISCYRLKDIYLKIESIEGHGRIGISYTNDGKALLSCLNGRRILAEEFISKHNDNLSQEQNPQNVLILEDGEVCALTRLWSSNYFHFIFDIVDKLLIAEQLGFKGKYMLFREKHVVEIIDLIDAVSSDRIIWIDNEHDNAIFLIKNLFEPEGFTHYARKGLPYLVKMAECITDKFSIEELWDYPKYIFVKRIGRRKLLNCDDIFNKYGFYTMIPEEHTFIEEIKFFYCADIVVVPHGAALANILFMRNKTNFLELFPMSFINLASFNIADFKKVHYNMLVETNLEKQQVTVDKSKDFRIEEGLLDTCLSSLISLRQDITEYGRDLSIAKKENSDLKSYIDELNQEKQELKLQLTALENTNKTLMSANSHLAQSVTEISSLLKNNTDSGE